LYQLWIRRGNKFGSNQKKTTCYQLWSQYLCAPLCPVATRGGLFARHKDLPPGGRSYDAVPVSLDYSTVSGGGLAREGYFFLLLSVSNQAVVPMCTRQMRKRRKTTQNERLNRERRGRALVSTRMSPENRLKIGPRRAPELSRKKSGPGNHSRSG